MRLTNVYTLQSEVESLELLFYTSKVPNIINTYFWDIFLLLHVSFILFLFDSLWLRRHANQFVLFVTIPTWYACSNYFCFDHLSQHRTNIEQEYDQLHNDHELLRQQNIL